MVLGVLGKAECGLSAPVAPAGPGRGSGGAQALGTRFPVETMTEGPGGSSVAGLGSAALFPSCSVFTVPFPFSLRVTAEEPAAGRSRLPPGFLAGARGSRSVPLSFPGGERLSFHPPPPPCLNSRSHLMQFLGRACMDSRDAAHGACGKFQPLALRLPACQWEHSLGSWRELRVRTCWIGSALLFQAFGCCGCPPGEIPAPRFIYRIPDSKAAC